MKATTPILLIGNLSFDIVVEVKVDRRHRKGVLEEVCSGGSLVGIGDEAPSQEPLTFFRNRLWDRWMSTAASNLEQGKKKKKGNMDLGQLGDLKKKGETNFT